MIRIANIINNNGRPSPNQFAIATDKARYFQSFDTVICVKNGNGVFLHKNWDCSNVTAKHLYIFLTKHVFFYAVDRKTVLNHIKNGYIKITDKEIEID